MRSFNEFQRLLKQHGVEGKLAIILTEMFEFMSALNKQQDDHLKITNSLADSLGGFMELNEAMGHQIKGLNKLVTGRMDGVSVASETMREGDGE